MSDITLTRFAALASAIAGEPVFAPEGDHTFTATVIGSGAMSATLAWQGSNDGVGWVTIATLSPAGAGVGAAQASTTSSYRYWRQVVSALTGSQVSAVVATEPAGQLVPSSVSGAGNGTAAATKAFKIGSGGTAIGAGATPTTQQPADFDFIGATLGYTNQSASPITITKAVAFPTAVHQDASQPAADKIKNVTFGGATSGTVPASPGGAGADTRSSYLFSDFVPVKSVPRTDDTSKCPLLQVRSHFAAAGNGLSVGAGDIAAWNAGPAAYGRQYAARIPAGDTTNTWTAAAGPLEGGTYIVPTIIIFHFSADVKAVWSCGDSNTAGHLTTGSASGWPMFAGGILRTSGKRYAFNNIAFTGQTLVASHLSLKEAILTAEAQGQSKPYAGSFFGWSPNDLAAAATAASTTVAALSDALSQATFDDGYARAEALGNWLEKKEIRPAIGSNGAWNTMTATQQAMRRANNVRLRALCIARGWTFIDFASVIDNPANTDQILPAYNQGDGLHYTDACHLAMGTVAAAAFP